MGLFDLILNKKNSNNKLVPQNNNALSQSTDNLYIHPDIESLLWVADGKRKNYVNIKKYDTHEFMGMKIMFSFMNQEEPSLIYTKLPLATVNNISDVERPPYFPSYSQLTPEQRYVYWKLLANPYNPNIDIGFVFILYYGLERHLLSGNYEKAFKVILKLRDVHNNNSFQRYSASALILTCLLKQRVDLVAEFMNSLDKDYELKFSDNLFILCKFSLDIPLVAKDIMRLAKSFEFNNTNYIKNYPELFEDMLISNIKEKYKSDYILISNIISTTEQKKARQQSVSIFANMSIIEKNIDVPMLIENFKFKKAMYDLLEVTHGQVKSELAELRKNGEILTKKETPQKTVILPTFNEKAEKEFLQQLNKCKKYSLSWHFALIQIQDFYYKNRDIDIKYLEKCIEYCMIDINSLVEIQKMYYVEEVSKIKQLYSFYNKNELNTKISEIRPFNGNIPAFKRLAIIFEKQKDFNKAIGICKQAINYYKGINMISAVQEFEDRITKIQSKTKS